MDLLAELATLAIARPIIVPFVGAVGDLLGVAPADQQRLFQQFGVSGGGKITVQPAARNAWR